MFQQNHRIRFRWLPYNRLLPVYLTLAILLSPGQKLSSVVAQDWVWWEGEDAIRHSLPKRPAFEPTNQDEADKLSGGKWLQTDLAGGTGAYWEIQVKEAGEYHIWARKFWKHGPFDWRFNQQNWQTCPADCALADNVELREHVVANWVYLGKAQLLTGRNQFEIKIHANATAAAFDCFIATLNEFIPRGKLKPSEFVMSDEEGWTAFEPAHDQFPADAGFDFRSLNQKRAGQDGFIRPAKDKLIHSRTGKEARFWGVNLTLNYSSQEDAKHLARSLAKRGVNLVRLHTRLTADPGEQLDQIDPATLDRIHFWLHALAQEGIFTKISFYFPLWFEVAGHPNFPGYEAISPSHPFALLFFNQRMQALHRGWLEQLLTPVNPYTGKPLSEDPALAIVELCNEDNLFFWTFKPYETIPAESIHELERHFAAWLKQRYRSINNAVDAWGLPSGPVAGDNFPDGLVGLYPAGHLTSQKWAIESTNRQRVKDQVRFFHNLQSTFYQQSIDFLRGDLELKCLISANNWVTADDQILGLIDKSSTFAADILDRHYYFSGMHQGTASSYALRQGQTYQNRSALFSPDQLPTNEITLNGKPSMVSEYGYPAPNRFRAESPVLAACYGSLLGTDAFLHFSHEGTLWQNTLSKFGLALPSQLGQFPATSFMFREGLIDEADSVYQARESLETLFKLRGSPVTQPRGLDQLRADDMPSPRADKGFNPYSYLVGKVQIEISPNQFTRPQATDLRPFINDQQKRITSSTRQLQLDYGRGILNINAPAAQGFLGFFNQTPPQRSNDLVFSTKMEYGSLLAVALDKRPLSQSRKILVQVVTEEKSSGWSTTQTEDQAKRIDSLGQPPIIYKDIQGSLSIRSQWAKKLRIFPLDANGIKQEPLLPLKASTHLSFDLAPSTHYYLITIE